MKFSLQGQEVRLRGLRSGTVHYASKRKLSRMTASCSKSNYTLLLTTNFSLHLMHISTQDTKDEVACIELQNMLQQHSRLFEEPVGLPPKRAHDHHIPLKDESQVVKVRPYRYPSMQKNEIERLVAEMKAAGVIRDNISPFASPVVLVKKKMAHRGYVLIIASSINLQLKIHFPFH